MSDLTPTGVGLRLSKTVFPDSRMSKFHPVLRVGQVVKKMVWQDTPIVKVRVQDMTLDKRLLMYFPRKRDRWSVDAADETKLGDIVIVQNLDERFGRDIKTKVGSILYKAGGVIDPITGRPCRGTEFIEEEERQVEQSKRKVEMIKLQKVVEVNVSKTE